MIRLSDVWCRHGRLVAVEAVDAVLAPGLTAIAGPNGAGKTTLLRAIAGLQKLSQGRIEGLDGVRTALLPQSGGLDRQFPITCRELVAFGAWERVGAFRGLPADDVSRVDAALARLGLSGLAGRPIGELSSGQFQRVLFARLIVQDASVILLDEPFTAVDAATETDLLALLHEWEGQGRTVVAVLHDRDTILRHFPITLLLARRRIAFGPSREALSEANRDAARQSADAQERRAA